MSALPVDSRLSTDEQRSEVGAAAWGKTLTRESIIAAYDKVFLICETDRMVSLIRSASTGSGCDENLAMTSSFLRSMKRCCPKLPNPNISGEAPCSTYHWLR